MLTVLLSAGFGLAAIVTLEQSLDPDVAAAMRDQGITEAALHIATAGILMVCVIGVIIGLVGSVSNSLLLHGARKVNTL